MESFPTTQIVLRADFIELSWGQPDSALLPANDLRRAAEAVLSFSGADALGYGANAGPGQLIRWLAQRIERTENRAVRPDEIVITGGNSDALHQICTWHTRPGDVALVESPTYHLAVRIMRDHALELVSAPVDAAGLDVRALADTLARLRREGRSPRLLYTIPTFHNPTGVSLSAERRQALVDLAAAEELLIVEDDVYRDLSYGPPAPPSLWSLAPTGTVARMGSFAKTLAPGLRLGWLTGHPGIAQAMINGGVRDSGGGTNHFTAMMVAALCDMDLYEPHVAELRQAYRSRRDALLSSLQAHMPDWASWSVPGGGFFVWVRLPEGIDAARWLPQAEAAGVSYIPGAKFHLDGSGANALRLAFSLFPPDTLVEGGRRLGMTLARPA